MHPVRTLLAALGVVATIAPIAEAQDVYETRRPLLDADVSLGLGIGDPSALDVKLWTTRDSGFNFGVGLENFDDVFGIYGEYELGLASFRLSNEGGRGVFYLGAGGAIAFSGDDTSVAVIIPLGLDFRFAPPVDLFIEARPGVSLDRPAFGIGGQLGVRFRI